MHLKTRSALRGEALKALPPARRAAFLALEQNLDRPGAPGLSIQEALDRTLRAARFSPLDAALATNLAYGTLRCEERLDYLLNKFLKRPERLAPAHKDILRLAAFELLFLENIPAYASLNWAVEAAKIAFGPALGGLTNAVLRKVADLKDKARDYAFFAEEIANPKKLAAVWHCQPEWIIEHFFANYPENDARAYLDAFTAAPVIGLRVNRRKADWEELAQTLAAEPGRILAAGRSLCFSAGAAPQNLEALIREGRASRQSYAAQEALFGLLAAAAAADPSFPSALQNGVWDACAGHGGKTCALLEAGIPVRLATDTHAGRLAGLRDDLARLGLNDAAPSATVADAAAPCPLPECPPVILADVPCSGLGTLNRRPDIKHKRKAKDLAALTDLQQRILDNLYACLPPNGWLLYITCTLNPAENEGQVEKLLARHPGAKLAAKWQTPSDSPSHEFFYAAAVRKE